MARRKYYVNVYLRDRAYGGPEEGGWWYDIYEPATHHVRLDTDDSKPWQDRTWSDDFPLSVAVDDKYQALWIKGLMEVWCNEQNNDRNSDVDSVTSEGRYEVHLERHKPKMSPERRPRYE